MIGNIEEVERVMGRWNTGDIAFIETLHLEPSEDGDRGDLIISFLAARRDLASRGWPAPNSRLFRVAIRFSGVDALALHDFGWPRTQIMGFDISENAGKGWERGRFAVEDYENGRIGFVCDSIDVLHASLA